MKTLTLEINVNVATNKLEYEQMVFEKEECKKCESVECGIHEFIESKLR